MIVLAVLLVVGIVSLLNSIPLSIRTIYGYSKQSLALTPRGDASQTQRLISYAQGHSPVPIERIITCRASSSMVRSIVGKWPFYVVGLKQEDMAWYLERQHAKLIEGRLPNAGAPEAVITTPVAKNLGLHLGSTLLGPRNTDDYSPHEVKVVGIAESDAWLMADPYEYQVANHFPPIDFAMIFAYNLHDQSILDHWADRAFRGKRAQVLAYHLLERETNQNFATLYKILNVVIGALVLVITLMMGMLINIYQSQRLVEFGLLQAIGYTKKKLIFRAISESAIVVLVGWGLGILLACGLLMLVKAQLMDPNAWALNPIDWVSFIYTLPAPICILSVAMLTVMLRFRRFDPVGVVERRLV